RFLSRCVVFLDLIYVFSVVRFCKVSFLSGSRYPRYQPIGKSSCHLARSNTKPAFNSPGSDYSMIFRALSVGTVCK
uniref:Uncharacterized protein n=1 Tax=Triticum urartu TaxID=4572 RepID=A0A8R7PQ77_TRIUA